MFKDKLKQARIQQNYKQSELADKLGVKNTTISNWETGISNPDVTMIEELCDVLQVPSSYFFQCRQEQELITYLEMEHLSKYRKLDSFGKKQVDMVLQNEYQRIKEQSMQIKEETAGYLSETAKTEYLTGLSAGTGLFVFDDVPTQLVHVPKAFDYIDFVISVSGDSMEPIYHDGDKVMVVKQDQVLPGEIGVFMVDGNGYIKEYGKQSLISHNKQYPDIALHDLSDISCIGKVVGVLKAGIA